MSPPLNLHFSTSYQDLAAASPQHTLVQPAEIWRQTLDGALIADIAVLIDGQHWADGCSRIPCDDCEGSGIFVLPDVLMVQCVACKGAGAIWCNLW